MDSHENSSPQLISEFDQSFEEKKSMKKPWDNDWLFRPVSFFLSIPFLVMSLRLKANSVISKIHDKHKLSMSDGFREKTLPIQRRNAFVHRVVFNMKGKHLIVLLWLVVTQHTYMWLNISFSILEQE